jgi:hypothetical protein
MRHLKPIKHITPLTACPKCNLDWVDGKMWHECPQCSMRYGGDQFQTTHSWSLPNFGKQGYYLKWNPISQECYYGCLEDFVNDKETRLPWLPYTITSQELTELLAKDDNETR